MEKEKITGEVEVNENSNKETNPTDEETKNEPSVKFEIEKIYQYIDEKIKGVMDTIMTLSVQQKEASDEDEEKEEELERF